MGRNLGSKVPLSLSEEPGCKGRSLRIQLNQVVEQQAGGLQI